MSSKQLRMLLMPLLLASCVGDIIGGGEEPDDEDPPPQGDPFEAAPPVPLLPQATIDALESDVAEILDGAETHTLQITNLSTGQVLVLSNADELRKPASNMKLFTSAAALEILGPDHRLGTRVYADAAIDANGSLAGDLWILGGHDFSASTYFYESDQSPLTRLAQRLYDKGLRSVEGDFHVSGEFVYAGYSLGTLSVSGERASMAEQLHAALQAAGISVAVPTTSSELTAPSGAELLLEHDPLSLVVASSPLNTVSHNEFADMLFRHLGSEIEGESSYGGGAQATMDWLSSFDARTEGLAFNDGSGLSHDNRVSAAALSDLLSFMNAQPVGESWRHGLAIAGTRGTIANRMIGDDTSGRVQAKTGTLRDTISLSGYLDNRHDGQRYAFAILLNNVEDKAASRARCDQIVERIATDLHAAAPRLPAPELQMVRGLAHAEFLQIDWQAVQGARSYLVWLSEDGRSWSREDARLVEGTRYLADGLRSSGPTYVKITAVDEAGFESADSVVMAASATDELPTVLLVDANERWAAEPVVENNLRENHNFLVGLAETELAQVASASNRAVTSGALDLEDFAAVIWATGEESATSDALSREEQELLRSYLDAGGLVLLSGSELMWALDQRQAEHDLSFVQELQAEFVEDDAETYEFRGAPGTSFADIELASFRSHDWLDVKYPDVLRATGQAESLLEYVGGTGGSAAVGQAGKLIVTGFPIEAMPSLGDRRRLLQAAYAYLGL